MQGRLRDEYLVMTIQTACAHCSLPMQMVIDSELKVLSLDAGAQPLVFSPDLDWASFQEPNILHAY